MKAEALKRESWEMQVVGEEKAGGRILPEQGDCLHPLGPKWPFQNFEQESLIGK